MKKQLKLNKELIAALGKNEENRIYGGDSVDPVLCGDISQIVGTICAGCPSAKCYTQVPQLCLSSTCPPETAFLC